MGMLREGDVIIASLGEGSGSVQRKRRPCLIVGDVLSTVHPLYIVSPITKQPRRNEYEFVQLLKLKYDSYIHYEQIFTISANDKIDKIYTLNEQEKEEMMLKRPCVLGDHFRNVLNIESIGPLYLSPNQVILGRISYKIGIPLTFEIPYSKYSKIFGEQYTSPEVYNNLCTLQGLQLILKEGVSYR